MTATATVAAEAARRLPRQSLARLAGAMDTDSRAAWAAMLVERGHSAAKLASLPTVELARMLVG